MTFLHRRLLIFTTWNNEDQHRSPRGQMASSGSLAERTAIIVATHNRKTLVERSLSSTVALGAKVFVYDSRQSRASTPPQDSAGRFGVNRTAAAAAKRAETPRVCRQSAVTVNGSAPTSVDLLERWSGDAFTLRVVRGM